MNTFSQLTEFSKTYEIPIQFTTKCKNKIRKKNVYAKNKFWPLQTSRQNNFKHFIVSTASIFLFA